MGWWSIGNGEVGGDVPAEDAGKAFGAIAAMRTEAGVTLLGFDDVATLLAAIAGRAGRDVTPRKEAELVGVTLRFEGGEELTRTIEEAKPKPEELAVMRTWLKSVATAYRAAQKRRPSFRELMEGAAFVLRKRGESFSPEETRTLVEIVPVFRHARGQLSGEEVLAVLAAAFRRSERRFGLLVRDGASMAPLTVGAKTRDGRDITAVCATAQADRDEVGVMCERFEALIQIFRDEKKTTELPPLETLLESIRASLAIEAERFAPLSTLDLVTEARDPTGLPGAAVVGGRPLPKSDEPTHVRHAKFGVGKVLRVLSDGDRKYEVEFDGGKRMTLMAKFVEAVPEA